MKMDVGLLVISLVRVALWFIGAYTFASRKRIVGTVGFGITTVNSFLFALINSHAIDSRGLQDLATVVATPGVALILCAVVLGASSEDGQRWQL